MRIGYACLAVAVPGSGLKRCTLKNASPERLLSLIGHNLDALQALIAYNVRSGISLFRISSDLIPFGSTLAAALPWAEVYADKLAAIGGQILAAGMRVSMHPGQYTVLNSPSASVAAQAAQSLDYHAKVLDSLGLDPEHKLVLHLGGVYGDKKQAKERFVSNYQTLSPTVRRRLVLENDDALFHIDDVLETAVRAGMPVVFDNLHNAVNPSDASTDDLVWIKQCAATWQPGDGAQKIHYSQQHEDKKPGAHAASICAEVFLQFCSRLAGMEPDIMLEVKDKNVSALKCMNCVSNRGIHALEAEWARYKYLVLEHSPQVYHAIRKLLVDKSAYPALEMYRMIEAVCRLPVIPGNAINAAQHVWGYFKDTASEAEKRRFQRTLDQYAAEEASLQAVKNNLLTLARKHQARYLLEGYYLYAP